MPRLLALEWDDSEARVVVASTAGGGLRVEDMFAVPLAPAEADAADAQDKLAARIAAALAAHRVSSRCETTVVVGRNLVELNSLTLPPCPAAELPDLVRFQSMREFHTLDEAWPLDYIPLSGDEQQPRQVLAAAIAPDRVERILQICREADQQPSHLLLRPYTSGSRFLRALPVRGDALRLLIDLTDKSADLTGIDGSQVVFMRTARLPGDVLNRSELAQSLLGEIRRTIAALQNQLHGRKVQSIHLCGVTAEHQALAKGAAESLGLKVECYDPLAGMELARSLKQETPANAARFAPLLGALLDHAQAEEDRPPESGLDFLNPRRAPAPPSRRRTWVLAATAAAAAVLLLTSTVMYKLNRLQEEIDGLKEQSQSLDLFVKESQRLNPQVEEIQAWLDSDVTVLNELAYLSQSAPAAEQTMLTQLRYTAARGGGLLTLEGLARDAEDVRQVEQQLRDARHQVLPKDSHRDFESPKYLWQFRSTVQVQKPAEVDEPATAPEDSDVSSAELSQAQASGEAP